MKKYHIRYNTTHGDSDLVRRVFEDGQQHLVNSFLITVPTFSEKTVEAGIEKWNLACIGQMVIIDRVAYIT